MKVPARLRPLLESMWAENPKERPSFKDLVIMLSDLYLDVILPDEDLAGWWRNHHTNKQSYVKIRTFLSPTKQLAFPNQKKLPRRLSRGMEVLFPQEEMLEEMPNFLPNLAGKVSASQFYWLVQWFGPFHEDIGSLRVMYDLLTMLWKQEGFFHGFLDRKRTEKLLDEQVATF